MVDTFITESLTNNPSAEIWLFKLNFDARLSSAGSGDSAIYFTGDAGDGGSITYDSVVYENVDLDFSAAIEDMEADDVSGRLVISGQYTNLVNNLNSYQNKIEGSEISFIKTHEKFLDGGSSPDTTANETHIYVIDSITEKSKSRIDFKLTLGVGTSDNNTAGGIATAG